jgi:hypothetical protein
MEYDDLASTGGALAIAQLFHQQAILKLQPWQHRTRGDVASLHQKLANPQGYRQGDQDAAPKGPGALLGRLFMV